METVEAQEGGPQPSETLPPDASNMTPSNAAAESSAPGARDEEDDDDAEGAAMRSSGRAPTIRKQIENRLLVRMQQAHISARPIPA